MATAIPNSHPANLEQLQALHQQNLQMQEQLRQLSPSSAMKSLSTTVELSPAHATQAAYNFAQTQQLPPIQYPAVHHAVQHSLTGMPLLTHNPNQLSMSINPFQQTGAQLPIITPNGTTTLAASAPTAAEVNGSSHNMYTGVAGTFSEFWSQLSAHDKFRYYKVNGIGCWFPLVAAWVACVVAWSATLHRFDVPHHGLSYAVNWYSFSGAMFNPNDSFEKCNSSGQAMVGISILAWCSFTVALLMAYTRTRSNYWSSLALKNEILFTVVGTIWYLIALCVWSACVTESTDYVQAQMVAIDAKNPPSFSTLFTGFGYMVLAMILLVVPALLTYIYVWRDAALHTLVKRMRKTL